MPGPFAQLSSRFRRLESAVNPKSTTDMPPNEGQDAAFDAAFSLAALDAEYEGLLRSHHDAFTDAPRIAAGSDRLTRTQFERQRTQHLTAASRQVLRGDYKFSGFLEREIPKDDTGDVRTISVAKIRDVVVQRALYGYLYPAVDARLTDSVFGYRRGRGAHDAVEAIEAHFKAGLAYVFDADLKGFFDSLNHDKLKLLIDGLAVDPRARRLAYRFCRAARVTAPATEATPDGARYPTESRKAGVPQGGVLSGLLANLYLASMDDAVRAAGGALVRYADDFVICCANQAECEKMRGLVEHSLSALDITLNPKKTTTCVHAPEGVEFLGFELRPGERRVRRKNVGKFKQRISKILSVAEEKGFRRADEALAWISWRIGLKITGPRAPYIDRMIAKGLVSHPDRRCWIGFFRIVTDDDQIRELDRWIRSQVSAHMWRLHRTRVRLTHMQAARLPSLVGQLWKARADAPPLPGPTVPTSPPAEDSVAA
jgi:RNA-directed DNA polymerase